MRAPYQILLFPFIKEKNDILFCIFKRKDLKVWQGIAGGGEDGESIKETVKREAFEEAGISDKEKIFQLDSISSMPVTSIRGFIWGPETPIVLEYSFGVELKSKEIIISDEHTEYKWVKYEEALEMLNYESNKTALWELNYRITNNLYTK